MFYILGTQRSGTTMLGSTLDDHPELITTYEANLFGPVCHIWKYAPDPEKGRNVIAEFIVNADSFPRAVGVHLTPEQVHDAVNRAEYLPAAIMTEIYNDIAARWGKKLAGDKSPDDIHSHSLLNFGKVFLSDIKVIHIVRDVRDVIASYLQITKRSENWVLSPGWEDTLPRRWQEMNRYLNSRYVNRPDNYLLVRYEDLTMDPEGGFRRICQFLGVDFMPEMLSAEMREGSLRTAYSATPEHPNLANPINTSRTGVWRTELEPALIARLEKHASVGLRDFGYELSKIEARTFIPGDEGATTKSLSSNLRAKFERAYGFEQYADDTTSVEHAKRFLAEIQPKPDSTILDFGSGAGHASKHFLDEGYRPIAIDIASNAMKEEYVGLFPFWRMSLIDEPIHFEGDYGFAVDLLQTIPEDYLDRALKLLSRSVHQKLYVTVQLQPDRFGNIVGADLNVTVKPAEWWKQKLGEFWRSVKLTDSDGSTAEFILSKPRKIVEGDRKRGVSGVMQRARATFRPASIVR